MLKKNLKEFYFNQGKLYTKRAKPISQFITNPYANHISYPTPCLQLNKYMRVGEYLETDCISNREDTFGSKTNFDAWNFSNIVEKELVVTPYGDFDAYKIITSHARWDDDDGDYENIDFDYDEDFDDIDADTYSEDSEPKVRSRGKTKRAKTGKGTKKRKY